MFKNKLLNMSIILLIAITLLGVVALVLYKYVLIPQETNGQNTQNDPGTPSIEEMVEMSVSTGELTTNLADNRYAVMDFTIVLNNKDAKEEVEMGLFLVKREIIGVLSSLTSEDLTGEEGVNAMEARIISRVNNILREGQVVKVVTTKRLIQ
jgi:flagellar FliL protein